MIIIPDIHGRTFWKTIVERYEKEEIIFLGDYVDPYSYIEDIDYWEGLASLKNVIAFKKSHPDNVTLLLGNHDLSYVIPAIAKCRHDYENHDDINRLLTDNIGLFEIAHEATINNKLYIFSHAGIHPEWLKNNEMTLGKVRFGNAVKLLNQFFVTGTLNIPLSNISQTRGGYDEVGSPIWADVEEFISYYDDPDSIKYADIFQIFGHTSQPKGQPIITSHFACLDCACGFCLDENGKIAKITA